VVIPQVAEQVQGGAFDPKEIQSKAARALLDELARYAEALKPLRLAPRPA
jgi:hypothetical protein